MEPKELNNLRDNIFDISNYYYYDAKSGLTCDLYLEEDEVVNPYWYVKTPYKMKIVPTKEPEECSIKGCSSTKGTEQHEHGLCNDCSVDFDLSIEAVLIKCEVNFCTNYKHLTKFQGNVCVECFHTANELEKHAKALNTELGQSIFYMLNNIIKKGLE